MLYPLSYWGKRNIDEQWYILRLCYHESLQDAGSNL